MHGETTSGIVVPDIFPSDKYPGVFLHRVPDEILHQSAPSKNDTRRRHLEAVLDLLKHKDGDRAFYFKADAPSRDRLKKILLKAKMEIFSTLPPGDPTALRKANVFHVIKPFEDDVEQQKLLLIRERQKHDRIVLPYDTAAQAEYIPIDNHRFFLPLSRNGLRLLADTAGVQTHERRRATSKQRAYDDDTTDFSTTDLLGPFDAPNPVPLRPAAGTSSSEPRRFEVANVR